MGTPADPDRVRSLVEELLARRDTGSQRRLAGLVADAYRGLEPDGRRRVLVELATEFGVDHQAVDDAMAEVATAHDAASRRRAERTLRTALTPRADELLQRVTGLPSGVKFLVDLRADLLAALAEEPVLAVIDDALRTKLATLFDVGLLELIRVTWDAPASLLEKLAGYEAVHQIESWSDLKNRLDADRRWFAFFHPAMPREPLVFVEVALTVGMATELPALLDERAPVLAPGDADTAVFYSISSTQPGLAGVNLGNALLEQVVAELRRDLPNLTTFATLSPVPGLRAWLDRVLTDGGSTPGERALLPSDPAEVATRLARPDWPADTDFAAAIRPGLLAIAARFLTTTAEGRVLDPVGNFHLSNGAQIARVNWLANPTPTGLHRAAGLMVNYRYEPDEIARRAEAYAGQGAVSVDPSVTALLA